MAERRRYRGLTWAVLAVLAAAVLPARAPAAQAAGLSVLIARPSGGHPGDLFYLSGTNLLPNHQYILFFACPDWHTPGVIDQGNYDHILNGPTTDAHGNFSRFPMHAIRLHGMNESGCHIYSDAGDLTATGAGGFGPDIPADYYIYAPGAPLKRCVLHMCDARAVPSPKRVRSGLVENILLHGWPGAVARVVLSYRGVAALARAVRLNSEGNYRLRMHAPAGVTKRDTVAVRVTFALGKYRDSTSASFTVVR